jgi:hypothetical protein
MEVAFLQILANAGLVSSLESAAQTALPVAGDGTVNLSKLVRSDLAAVPVPAVIVSIFL